MNLVRGGGSARARASFPRARGCRARRLCLARHAREVAAGPAARWLILVVCWLPARPAGAGLVQSAEEAHRSALRFLEQGDAHGAETAVREALARSSRFSPEQEIRERPEKGLLFEDMIAQARAGYRERRARYYLTLGHALSRQERWVEARNAFRRAAVLTPTAEPHLAMASHPDLTLGERTSALLAAYFSAGSDRASIEKTLMETGVFPSRDVLEALLEQRRLSREGSREFPGLEVWLAPLPELRVATDRGLFVSADRLRSGRIVVLYMPQPGCPRCSEELDGANRALEEARKSGKPGDLIALVGEEDLLATRRVARLLAMDLEVGRADRLPPEVRGAAAGEIRIVSRRGFLQIRLPLEEKPSSTEIRRGLLAVMARLGSPGEAGPAGQDESMQRIDQLEREGRIREAFIAAIELAFLREAGPTSPDEVYRGLERMVPAIMREGASPGHILEVLGQLARLRGAGSAKGRALAALDERIPQKLLEAARRLAPEVSGQAPPEQGAFWLVISGSEGSNAEPTLVLQRTFMEGTAQRHFDFVLKVGAKGLSVAWTGEEPDLPSGVAFAPQGAVFRFLRADGCRGLRVVGDDGLRYQGCPACLLNGEVVEEREALVDPVLPSEEASGPQASQQGPAEAAPSFYRRGTVQDGNLAGPEAALERGLSLFHEGRYEAALSAFEEAEEKLDPTAPYEEVDLRYNRARCLEAMGKRREALVLYRSIGDVAYQSMVDERTRRLESGGAPDSQIETP